MSDRESEPLAMRVQELEELNRLAVVLGGTMGVAETMEAIIRCSLKLCRAERGAIVLFDTDVQSEVHTLVRNSDSSVEPIDHRINMIVAGYIQDNKEPFVSKDIIASAGYVNPPEYLRDLGAAMAVPLSSDGKVIGMINHVNSRSGESFTLEQERVATIIANIASQFIVRAKLHENLQKDNQSLRERLSKGLGVRPILGESRQIRKVRDDVTMVAPSSANVLIVGETGTGKELVAHAIHQQSHRFSKPFVAVNCAAIPAELFESELFGHDRGAFTGARATVKGKFELADGGTLFLDEISEMPLPLQPKLLRVLEEKKLSRVGSAEQLCVDVRVIAASSRDLAQAASAGEFREALFHRLNVVPITLPPLRERKDDIPLLAHAMMNEFSSGSKIFEPAALELLIARRWQGNVRELRNAVERISIFVKGRTVSADDIRSLALDSDSVGSGRLVSALRELMFSEEATDNKAELIEKELIKIALEESAGNVTQAARLIGIERMSLQRRLEKYGMQKLAD
jgi:transcriptional regulator with GAF, ATPase, and Fis domain